MIKKGRRPYTVEVLDELDDEVNSYLCDYRRLNKRRKSKRDFVEIAIIRELARVRGIDPDELQSKLLGDKSSSERVQRNE